MKILINDIVLQYIIFYEKKIWTVMVNNSPNINKTNNQNLTMMVNNSPNINTTNDQL